MAQPGLCAVTGACVHPVTGGRLPAPTEAGTQAQGLAQQKGPGSTPALAPSFQALSLTATAGLLRGARRSDIPGIRSRSFSFQKREFPPAAS